MSRYVVRTYKVAVPKELYPLCAELNKTAARIYNKTMSLVKKIKYKKGFWLSPITHKIHSALGLQYQCSYPF